MGKRRKRRPRGKTSTSRPIEKPVLASDAERSESRRGWIGVFVAILGTSLAVLVHCQNEQRSHRQLRSEIDVALNQAFDLLGGEPGTTVIREFNSDRNDLERARRLIWDEALKLDEGYAESHRLAGIYWSAKRRNTLAEQALRKALELDPESMVIYSNLSRLLNDADRPDEALALSHEAISKVRDKAAAYNHLGAEMRNRDREEEAIAAFRKSLEVDPENALVHNNLGTALSSLDRNQEALDAYRAALEIDPDSVAALRNLGFLYVKARRFSEAEQALRKSMAIDPNHGLAQHNLGVALYQLNRFSEAEVAFRRSIELAPHPNSYINLGEILEILERPTEAEDAYRKAEELGGQISPSSHPS